MKWKSRSTFIITLLTLLFLHFPLQGDVIHLKSGRKFEGQIVEESENELRLRIQEGIYLTVKKEHIEKIEKKKTPFEICQEKLAQAKAAKDFEAVLKYFGDEKVKSEELFSKIKEGLILARKREGPKTFCQRCNAWGETHCPECAGKGYKEEPCNLCDERGLALCSKCEGSGKVSCYACGGKREVLLICDRCGGKGNLRCQNCRGHGRVTCARCDGDGTLRCVNCRGSGEITERRRVRIWDEEEGWTWVWSDVERTCPTCGGTGELACLPCDASGYFRCGRCQAKGRLRCGPCAGKGKVIQTCRMCQGTGWLFCSRCTGLTKITCPNCRATKIAKISCKTCGANGVIKCPECDGKGIKKQKAEIPSDPEARQPGK